MRPHQRLIVDSRTLLSCIPLFAGLKADRLARLGAAGNVFELPARHALFGAGQIIQEAHFLVSGSIKRFALLSDKSEKVLELVRPGHMFALSELFSGTRYSSFAETTEKSVVIGIAIDSLREVMAQDATLCSRLLEAMARYQHASEFEVFQHSSVLVTQRVLDYLLGLAGEHAGHAIAGETTVRLGASKKLIASKLGMAPETFSRTLRQLSDDAVIAVEGRLVHIQNATLAINGRGHGESSLRLLRYPRMEQGAVVKPPSLAALVNSCGRFRMLSQRMATAWGMHARGLAVEASRVALRKECDQFERNLALVGSPLPPDSLREPLESLRQAWPVYRDALTSESLRRETGDKIFLLSEQMLLVADRLTATAVVCSGTIETLRVNLAGRNRMLCARLTKLCIFSGWGVRVDEAGGLVAESRLEFLANMQALAGASAGAPEVQAQLQEDDRQWQRFVAAIDAEQPLALRRKHALVIVKAGEELLRHVDTTVKLYEKLAEDFRSATDRTTCIESPDFA